MGSVCAELGCRHLGLVWYVGGRQSLICLLEVLEHPLQLEKRDLFQYFNTTVIIYNCMSTNLPLPLDRAVTGEAVPQQLRHHSLVTETRQAHLRH